MAFKGFEEEAKRAHDEWWSHISPEIKALVERPTRIGWAEYQSLRMNSWEREEVHKRLDDEALANVAAYCLSNCQRQDRKRPCQTYDDAMAVLLVPLLIERLRKKTDVMLVCPNCGNIDSQSAACKSMPPCSAGCGMTMGRAESIQPERDHA